MCGKAPKTPEVVQRDPVADQALADTQATMAANSATAARRRRRNASTGGGLSAVARAAALRNDPAGKSLLAQATPEG